MEKLLWALEEWFDARAEMKAVSEREDDIGPEFGRVAEAQAFVSKALNEIIDARVADVRRQAESAWSTACFAARGK